MIIKSHALSRPLEYLRAVLVAVCLVACPVVALAESIIFTIDHAHSGITWSGTDAVYGGWVPQSPGSLTSFVSGHFLANFDPLSGTPLSLQLVGGHGYVKADTAHIGSPTPPPGWLGEDFVFFTESSASPANLAGRAGSGSPFTFAVRNYAWDFTSGVMSPTGSMFPATQSSYAVLDGDAAGYVSSPIFGFAKSLVDLTPDHLDGGSWGLTESAPGSGDWTLTLSGLLFIENYDIGWATGTDSFAANIVATAHFGAGNTDSVGATDTDAVAGDVAATFSQATGGGTFTAQKLPDATGLSQDALSASGANPVFSLSTDTLSANPQIWNVDFTGNLDGNTATLVFNYDPLLLPPGVNENSLGIWHFNSSTDDWDFGGTVDADANTVTYMTDSFSPFQLGVVVPEPSSLALAGVGLVGLVAWRFRRRR